MTAPELLSFLQLAGLSQADLAKLLDVTPRAVALWLAGERAVPGPTEAYVRVFASLSVGARSIELRRLKDTKPKMRDGMYAVQYTSGGGAGYATVILDGGRVTGADPAGGKYDGYYTFDETSGLAKVQLKVTFPPNVPAVFGPAHPFEWSVDIVGNMDPRVDSGLVEFATTLGPKIHAQYQFLREMPTALAS